LEKLASPVKEKVMQAQLTQAPPSRHPPLAALARLTAASLAGSALLLAVIQLFVLHALEPEFAVPMMLLLGAAALILTRLRWAPLVGGLLSGVLFFALVVPALDRIVFAVVHPGNLMGPLLLALLPLLAVNVGAGVAATVQNYRAPVGGQRLPRWLVTALVGLGGLIIGSSALHLVAVPAGGLGVSPDVLASLPALSAHHYAFDRSEIRVKAGELVALRLVNLDDSPHSFDIDAFDVHVFMPAGEESLAMFVPSEPGTYTFYCAPHYSKETGQGMSGTLVVEP
jgi:plastocyanin